MAQVLRFEDGQKPAFFRALHAEGYRYLCAVHKDKEKKIPAIANFFEVNNLEMVWRWAEDNKDKDRHLYFGVAERVDHKDDTRNGLQCLRVLFADFDYKNFKNGNAEAEVRAKLATFPLAPSATVSSGGGLHVYWLLDQPLPLREVVAPEASQFQVYAGRVLKTLAIRIGADPLAAKPTQLLRIPGSLNIKPDYGEPRPVVLEEFYSDRVYRLEEVLQHIGPLVSAVEWESKAPVDHGKSTDERKQAAIAWLSKQLPAVSGEHGDQRTFVVCASVTRGFDLSVDDAYDVLLDWNARCSPPWSERELRDKLKNGRRSGKEQIGGRLRADVFPCTESGDAEFFALMCGDRVRYDYRRGRWLLFDAHHWQPQADGEVDRLALDAVRARQLAAVGDKDRMRWAINGEARKRRGNLLALAQSELPIADKGDGWDVDPWLLGVLNGVVDLRTGELRDGRAEDRITMRAGVAFDLDARCPIWDATVEQIFGGDEKMVSYLDRFLGYSLTGDCREEAFPICWGEGGTGKGTLMNTVAWVLGDYADDLPFSSLEMNDYGSGIPNDIAKLVGKRFVTSSETSETRRLNEARIKSLTGRDPITARFLHREFFTFQPVAKFWLATNPKPVVRDSTSAFWRRVHLIPFTKKFEGEALDKKRKDDLRTEGSGILARLVRGCLAWQKLGLDPPELVKEATKAYQVESLPLVRFFDECCAIEAGATATFQELFETYVRWAASTREGNRLGRHSFNDALRADARFSVDSNDTRVTRFVGLRVTRTI